MSAGSELIVMFETILVPTDGSEGTERAAEVALTLAAEQEASLHVLHVVDTSVLPLDGHSKALLETLEERAEASVTDLVERAAGRGIDPVSGDLREGVPHREILDYAADNDVDLIVMGTHGRSELGKMVLGSVTDRVIRRASIPVLTVRMPSDE